MKKTIFTLLSLIVIYLIMVTLDANLKPETTNNQIDIANKYVTKQDLPTPPKTFYHDGCTSSPDYLLWHDFTEACFNHDIGYWAGGDIALKDQTDLAFRNGISETGPLGPIFAFVMYHAVANFGDNMISHILGSNWGYGWND